MDGGPGVLRFMGLQRVRHDWATDLIWSDLIHSAYAYTLFTYINSIGLIILQSWAVDIDSLILKLDKILIIEILKSSQGYVIDEFQGQIWTEIYTIPKYSS